MGCAAFMNAKEDFLVWGAHYDSLRQAAACGVQGLQMQRESAACGVQGS